MQPHEGEAAEGVLCSLPKKLKRTARHLTASKWFSADLPEYCDPDIRNIPSPVLTDMYTAATV